MYNNIRIVVIKKLTDKGISDCIFAQCFNRLHTITVVTASYALNDVMYLKITADGDSTVGSASKITTLHSYVCYSTWPRDQWV